MDEWSLIIGVFTGAVGLAYFVYGKKQSKAIPLISGIGLMVVPYIIYSPLPLALICVVLLALPFVIKA